MKALKYKGNCEIQLETIPIPKIQDPKDVLVKVDLCGFCATDLAIQGGYYRVPVGITVGHEIVGIIEEVGAECTEFKKGERVTLNPHGNCSDCFYCDKDMPSFCIGKRVAAPLGMGSDGGIANYVIVEEKRCFKVPNHLPFEHAVLTEPLSCILHSLTRGQPIEPHHRVLIMGAGFIGTMATICLTDYNVSKLTVCELSEARRQKINNLRLPNVEVVEPNQLMEEKERFSKDPTYGYDRVFDYTGADAAIQLAFELLAKGGKLVLFGVMKKNCTAKFVPAEILFKELTVTASDGNAHAMQASLDKLANLSKINQIDLDGLNVRIFPLANYLEAIELFKKHKYSKIIFKL